MGESAQSRDGSNCKFGRKGRETSLEHGLKVCKKNTKTSSYARSDGLKEASKSNTGVAQYQHCIPSPMDEKDCYGGELNTQKDATNDVDCLNDGSSDISWALQQCTPLEFAVLSQVPSLIFSLYLALSLSRFS
jgi:hypothetical protein